MTALTEFSTLCSTNNSVSPTQHFEGKKRKPQRKRSELVCQPVLTAGRERESVCVNQEIAVAIGA